MKPELLILLVCGGALFFSKQSEEDILAQKEAEKIKEDTKQRTKDKEKGK